MNCHCFFLLFCFVLFLPICMVAMIVFVLYKNALQFLAVVSLFSLSRSNAVFALVFLIVI